MIIHNILKKMHSQNIGQKSEYETQDSEEFNIEFSGIKNFASKNFTVLLIAAVLILQFTPNYGFLPWGGLWMRMQTQDLHLLDDLAQNSVYNFYKNQVAQQVTQQYPILPDENKNKLIDDQLQKVIKENKGAIDEQIKQTAEYFKDFERYEENGIKYTMMPDIDPYQYLRLAKNYINYGRLGDGEKDGKSWDTKVLAPVGRDSSANTELQPYMLAYIYKIAKIFKPQIPLMQAAAYFPIIFVTLAVIFTFLLGRKITNNIGGFFAAIMIGIHTAGLSRTQWGHADTDAYNLFFPIIIIWLFVEILETKNFKKKIVLSILNSAVLGLYAFAWAGWWYIFDSILAALFVQIAYTLVFDRQNVKSAISTFAVYLIGTSIFRGLLKEDFISIIHDIIGPLGFGVLKQAAHFETESYLLPNVYTTVAELNPTSFNDAI